MSDWMIMACMRLAYEWYWLRIKMVRQEKKGGKMKMVYA